MRMLDLFAGIGGFSLAGHWMGWETVGFVEWDSFCQKVLKKNFPGIPIWGDIKDFNKQLQNGEIISDTNGEFWGERGKNQSREQPRHRESTKGCISESKRIFPRPDIITGGFPCQPFSHAGKRKGTDDSRYLWPEMLTTIRTIKPSFVVGENVAGLVSMENGKTLERIFSDLENEGYAVESFIIPACGVGAWHKRDRIWILAYTRYVFGGGDESGSLRQDGRKFREGGTSSHTKATGSSERSEALANTDSNGRTHRGALGRNRQGEIHEEQNTEKGKQKRERRECESREISQDVPDSNTKGLQRHGEECGLGKGCEEKQIGGDGESISNTEIKSSPRNDNGKIERSGQGESGRGCCETRKQDQWSIEPDVGRVAHGISGRVDRLKSLGNAIVPQVVYEIFKAIENGHNRND